MTKYIKRLFGEIKLTWPRVIIAAVAAGVFTAVMAIIPALHYTSMTAITQTFEVWILFGIIIIMNSKSALDSALKCFVFFLISQPLVYLLQVPFSSLGWDLLKYYPYWFVWTILCLPMGYIGYYMKKDKWWGYLILLPMILLTALSYQTYFSSLTYYFPRYILISLFCACAMVLYPVMIFDNKKIRITGAAIGAAATIALTVFGLMNPRIYSTDILSSSENCPFDDSYNVYLADEKYGDVSIVYIESIEDYMVHADFKRAGSTTLTIESPSGDKTEYDVSFEIDTYTVTKR